MLQTNTENERTLYSVCISLFSPSSLISRIYSTLLQLRVKGATQSEPNQHIAKKSRALSIDVLFATSQLPVSPRQLSLPADSCKHHRKPDSLRLITHRAPLTLIFQTPLQLDADHLPCHHTQERLGVD